MKLFLTLCFAIFFSYASPIETSKQLLVVTTENWTAPTGTLQRYERDRDHWKSVGKTIEIKLGRNGLGWGIGMHQIPKDAKIIKKEGDGKSPAGIFRLNQAFGYASFRINYPYEVYKETDHCVDDVNSVYYNKIVDSTKIQRDYESHERMKFPKDYYKYGIVVDHNGIADGENAKKGAGSCIFIHIKDIPTAGCTVMSEDEIKEILLWLDPAAKPLLVQGTYREIKGLLQQIQ